MPDESANAPASGATPAPDLISTDGTTVSSVETWPAWPKGMPRWLLIAFLAFAVLVICGVRLRLLNFPLERDEGEYAYAGQLILEGIAPYKLAYSMKMPGVFLAYAGIMAVFGQTCAGIHFGLLLVNLATMAALFILARRILDLPGAVVAAAAYGFLTLSPALLGLAAHATHFVVLPALLGLWLLHRMADGGRAPWFNCFGAGLLFGLAFIMKQQGVFFGIFGGLWLIWIGVRAKAAPIWLGRRLGIYSLGCLAPFLGVCVWMKLAGVFPQFWFWTFAYARQYAALMPIRAGIFRAEEGIGLILHGAPLVCAAAALGTECLCLIRLPWNTRIFLGGLLVFSAMAVCPGLYFRHHYFIVAAPALALLAGLFVSWGGRYVRGTGARLWVACLPLFLAVLACAESLLPHRDIYFTLPPDRACRSIYGLEAFPESPLIARYLAEHTQPDEPVLVLGSEPQIYFYSHRHSSTGQIYMYPLVEAQVYARQMQADMIREIEKHPPACLVLVSVPSSWQFDPGSSHQTINWAAGYVNEHMRQVGLFELNRADTARPIWGAEAETTPLDTDFYVAVFKRSDPAPAGDRGRIAARNADLFHRFERGLLDMEIIQIRKYLASQPKNAQAHNQCLLAMLTDNIYNAVHVTNRTAN